jgi:hypothetical protein
MAMADAPSDAPVPPLADDAVAPPPRMPVQSALYITPDGRVQFGALFEELLPVARALDPSFSPAPAAPKAPDGDT